MSDLDTLSRLQDIRLRIANRERIEPAEMRAILLDIARDRESASKLGARNRAAAKKATGATPVQLDITTMFRGSGT